jgi:hypothetical protein
MKKSGTMKKKPVTPSATFFPVFSVCGISR